MFLISLNMLTSCHVEKFCDNIVCKVFSKVKYSYPVPNNIKSKHVFHI